MISSAFLPRAVRLRRWALAALALPLLATACSSDKAAPTSAGSGSSASASSSAPAVIAVTLSDTGCDPRSIAAQSGPTTFDVTNSGSEVVDEFEVLSGSQILGEVEHVASGTDKTFSLDLEAGSYTTHCPGGTDFNSGTLEVANAPTGAAANKTDADAAVQSYLSYVKGEADKLVQTVGPFAAAVEAGDITSAKNQFAATRSHYESIEPIAESFGDLDPAIDARQGDVPDDQWTGFHRIEKALWVDNTTDGVAPVATQLVSDVARLRSQIDTIQLQPAQIANGAVELLDEVSTSKITGEEDRYSHTDLSDFAANLAGSKAAFEAVRPLLASDQSQLADQIEQRFGDVQTELDTHKGDDPTGNGYVLYTALTPDQTRALSTSLDGLAEPMSRVAAQVL